jgi:hypothetical protein
METLFLAFAFRDPDRQLAAHVERVIASHGLRAVTGENLEGQPLSQEVKDRIDRSDGLVALLTRREDPGAVDGTHPWVRDELNYARGRNKDAIGLVAPGVVLQGMYADRENIPLDPNAPMNALLRLSETVGRWKHRAGRPILIRVEPEEAAQLAAKENGVTCKYRVYSEGQMRKDWTVITAVEEPGGVFMYVPDLRDGERVRIEVQYGDQVWRSVAEPQWLRIALKKQVAAP